MRLTRATQGPAFFLFCDDALTPLKPKVNGQMSNEEAISTGSQSKLWGRNGEQPVWVRRGWERPSFAECVRGKGGRRERETARSERASRRGIGRKELGIIVL